MYTLYSVMCTPIPGSVCIHLQDMYTHGNYHNVIIDGAGEYCTVILNTVKVGYVPAMQFLK